MELTVPSYHAYILLDEISAETNDYQAIGVGSPIIRHGEVTPKYICCGIIPKDDICAIIVADKQGDNVHVAQVLHQKIMVGTHCLIEEDFLTSLSEIWPGELAEQVFNKLTSIQI